MKKFFGFTKIIKPTTWSYTENRERERWSNEKRKTYTNE
jgi:hypothetical protein